MEDKFKESLDIITSNKDAYNIVYKLVEEFISKLYSDEDIEELLPNLKNIKLKKDELRKVLIESMIEHRVSKLLTTTVICLLINLIEPEIYHEKYEKLEKLASKDVKKSSDEKNLVLLLGGLFDIAKQNIIESVRKKNLPISSEEQKVIFIEASRILKDKKKKMSTVLRRKLYI